MKTLSFMVVISFCVAQTKAQDTTQTQDQILFDHAVQYFADGHYTRAAEEFETFLSKFPTSPLLGRAHYNLGLTHYRLLNYITAKKVFLQILDQPYNEQDKNDIMEPYTLYKHHSCRMLTEIALVEKDYRAAEKYIRMFDEEYPYQHFCGNEWAAYDMYKAVMLAKAFEGQGETKKALGSLLPYIFSNALASNEEVLRLLTDILEAHYSQEQNQQAFAKALATLEIKETKKSTRAFINLYDVKIEVNDYNYETKNNSSKEYYEHSLREHELFKRFL